ncbi:MAG: invasin domain 3-containing protein, partial [Candidatus Bathyarchaeia archaeon]
EKTVYAIISLSTLTISLSETTVSVGRPVTIEGYLSPARSGASIVIQVRSDVHARWSNLATVTTDARGYFKYEWTPESIGAYELCALYAGDLGTLKSISDAVSLTVSKLSSLLTISLSASSVNVGNSVTIQGSLSPAKSGVSITVLSKPSGGEWGVLTTVTTDATGAFAYSWTPESVGAYELKASWIGDEGTLGSESTIVSLTVSKLTSLLTISLSAASVNVGNSVTIQGSLSPAKSGASITIQLRTLGGSWSTLTTVTTDASGAFSYSWTPRTEESYELKASWPGDDRMNGAESGTVSLVVRAPPFPTELIIALAGVLAIVAVIAALLMRRPKRPPTPPKPKPTALRISANPMEILADGRSSSQLTIELLDETGKPMATERDMEILLSATSGRVDGSVTLPRGQSFVTTTLTSSTSVGKVVVSVASKDLKGASVEVIFREKRRYCMHCGQRMPLDAKVCPSCGNAPPSGIDVKVCRNCGSVIPVVAKFCSECGAGQPT